MQSKDVYNRLELLGINLVHLDVSRHQIDSMADPSKISNKNKPTFLLRADDSLHKIPPQKLNSEFPEGLNEELIRITSNRLIWSTKDLADALKKNNTELDSLTMVYVYDKENFENAQVALRLMRHES